jgi:hypothetical protein
MHNIELRSDKVFTPILPMKRFISNSSLYRLPIISLYDMQPPFTFEKKNQ